MKTISARMRAARQRRESQALERAVRHAGSFSALARLLDVSYQSVQGWCKERVPFERCPQIELATLGAVQCEELREDYRGLEQRPYRRVQRQAVYVAGPMSGLPELNYPAFHAEAKRLRKAGLRVVNPAEIVTPLGARWEDRLRTDLIALLTHCDTVCLLPGWRASPGARMKLYVARKLKMRVLDAGELA